MRGQEDRAITKNFKIKITDLFKKWINHFSSSDLIFKSCALIGYRLRKKGPDVTH
jgi:hypothetical protein